jgi:dual specificity protein kinase YAK1
MLGQGTFGQVFKCSTQDNNNNNSSSTDGFVAVKVIKNQAAYYHQARVEIGVLQFLNTRGDPTDECHIVRLKDFFLHKKHLCLVFELLNLNLFELIRHNRFRGLSLPLVRVFLSQILKALAVLNRSNIIHCDIKPENILLTDATSGEVKLIDFGSACFSSRTVYTYIQSRFYRSPEVVLGHKYTMSVDMWSLGCVAAELFLGLPLFPAACELDLLLRIVETIGLPPEYVLEQSKNTSKFFTSELHTSSSVSGLPSSIVLRNGRYGEKSMRLKTPEEFVDSTGQKAPLGKQYFQHKALVNIINAYPFRQGLNEMEIKQECARRESFTDFLLGLLNVDPIARWTPRQAQMHPFITGSTFTGPFQPLPDPIGTTISTSVHVTSHTVPVSAVQGIPMSIPQPSRVQAATAMATTPSALDSIAAAVVASSPQMHAQAHAAAMAAVQMQMNMQQQQHQGRSIPIYKHNNSSGGGGVSGAALLGTSLSSSSPYIAAHSLQRIMDPPLGSLPNSTGLLGNTRTSSEGGEAINQWRVGSYSAGGGAGGIGGGGMPGQPSFFSPPSRSFGVHLQSMPADQQLTPPSFDPGYSSSPHRIMPLMHLPGGGNGREQPDASPIPFQPSSVSTYRSTLAATAAATAAAGGNYSGGLFPSARQQQYQQQQYKASAAAAAAKRQEPIQRTAGFVVPGGSGSGSGDLLPEAMSIPTEDTSNHTPIAPLPPPTITVGAGNGSGGGLTGGGDDDSSNCDDEEASPPEKQQDEGGEEDLPNPDADWDPLWTDDLLTEEESFDQIRSIPNNQNVDAAPPPLSLSPPRTSTDASLALAAQHLTQIQPLDALGGVSGQAEPPSPHGSFMEGISHTESMMWSPPRTAVATILKSLPQGNLPSAIGGQQQQLPQQPPAALQLEPYQRLQGFVVSSEKQGEETDQRNDNDTST